MHHSSRELSVKYWDELIRDDYFLKFLWAAVDGPVGKPRSFPGFPPISPQSIQHAYCMALMEREGIDLQTSDVVEIGGGYGNFARILKKRGHAGRYRIVDLPAIHKIQKHYLDQTVPGHGVEFIGLDDIAPANVLIGTFSVSEMPMDERNFLEYRYDEYNAVFLATNESFCGFQNIPYFEALAKRMGAKFWKDKHRNAWFLCKT